MKQKKLYKFLFFFLLLSATFVACQKDTQTDPATQNNPGTTTADRDKFLGSWITQSNGTSGQLNFTMNITAGASTPAQIKMENFDLEGNGTFVFGYVSGNSVSIPQGTENNVNGDTISGSGMYNSNNTLTFNYTLRNSIVDVRTATAHK